MFNSLSERLNQALKHVTGQAKLTQENIQSSLREVRMALLEADVALPVVKEFINNVKEKAIGQVVSQALNPGQQFLKLVENELIQTMGEVNEKLELKTQPPAVILMAGLQGAGKTTSVAKLARFLAEREKKRVMTVSADVYRPAAIKQLETLSAEVKAQFFSNTLTKPEDIVSAALDAARKQVVDVLIIDTAGRLSIDKEMMDEITTLHKLADPIETLFVVDAMTGQDAAITAKAFHEALPLTGIILSKADGDSRGGAALSVRHITGKPIKFLGMGEKVNALEPFHPDRIASRILDMGDMLSLIEEMEQKVDKGKAEKLASKIKKGQGFNLEDFREQLRQMNRMGGLTSMLDKLPGGAQLSQASGQINMAEKQFKQMSAIIDSMTLFERHMPDKIIGSRKKRIAAGSGVQVQDVNRLLKQHKQMAKMMKKMGRKGGIMKMMRSLGEGMPPGAGGGKFPF